ncbi:MAG: hypothetical protein JXR38_00950 [Bacilli bacterium]|nr:hypothetical protein [Bacilli bacterium]
MSANFMGDFAFNRLANYVKGGAILPAPDQHVGLLRINNEQRSFKPMPRDTIDYYVGGYSLLSKRSDLGKNILVVLESPHRYEYDFHGRPIGLAMGATGNNFFRHFTYALSKSRMKIADGDYDVILANAVQYQASCGLNPLDRVIRDNNWIDVFENNGGKLDFKQRIMCLNPKYIINLCTGGRNTEGLRQRVSDALDQFGYVKGITFAEGNHPASWDRSGDLGNAIIF